MATPWSRMVSFALGCFPKQSPNSQSGYVQIIRVCLPATRLLRDATSLTKFYCPQDSLQHQPAALSFQSILRPPNNGDVRFPPFDTPCQIAVCYSVLNLIFSDTNDKLLSFLHRPSHVVTLAALPSYLLPYRVWGPSNGLTIVGPFPPHRHRSRQYCSFGVGEGTRHSVSSETTRCRTFILNYCLLHKQGFPTSCLRKYWRPINWAVASKLR